MKLKIVIKFLSAITGLIALSMVMPWLWAVRSGTRDAHAFLSSLVIGAFVAFCMHRFSKDANNSDLGQREAFACVTFSWIAASVLGALPFLLGGYCSSFTDAFF